MTKHLQKMILLMMLCVVGTVSVSAESFISGVKMGGASYSDGASKGKSRTANGGYTVIDEDLNYCGKQGWYVYVGYKTSTNPSDAITGLLIVEGQDYQSDDYCEGHTKSITYNGKTYYRAPAEGTADFNAGDGSNTPYLTLFYTKTKSASTALFMSLKSIMRTGKSGYEYAPLRKANAEIDTYGSTNYNSHGNDNQYYLIANTHTHTYNYKYDSSYHWYECSCGYTFGKSSHTLKYVDLADGTHKHWCATCRYIETTEAHPLTYKDNGDGTHKYWCENCGHVESTGGHTLTYKDNGDGTHKYWCASCGYIESTEAHTFGETDNGDGTCTRTCSICNHTDNGVTYRYPIYNTVGNSKSGVRSWTTGYCYDYEEVTSDLTSMGSSKSWYVVSGKVNINTTVKIQEYTNLILKDGATLTITSGTDNYAGINSFYSMLAIYGQDKGTGALTAIGGANAAGIGGNSNGHGGNVTINGGVITAIGGANAAGIGGGYNGFTFNILINGGIVKANGGTDAWGIGSGDDEDSSGNIYVSQSCAVKADGNNPPVTLIPNDGSDLTSSLYKKQYVEINPYLEYEQYKAEKAAYIRTLGLSDDTDADKAIISNAAAAVEALTYDTSKTLADNKAAVDAIVSKCIEDLAAQRLKDPKAIVDADNHKVTFKGEWTCSALSEKLASGTFDNGSLEASKVGLADISDATVTDPASSITLVNPNTLVQAKTTSQVANEYNVLVDGVCNKFLMTDGNEFTCPVGFTATNVSYSRSFTGQWQPLYLPFSIAVDNLKADYDIAYIIGVRQEDTDNDGAIDYQCIDVAYVPEGTKTNANYPYIIRRKTAADNVTTDLGSMAVLAAADNTVDCSTFLNTYYIHCSYSQTSAETLSGKYSFSDDALMLNNGTAALAPQSWYLSIESSADAPYDMKSQSNSAKFFIHIIGEEEPDVTTGIINVNTNAKHPASSIHMFNLAGQRVNTSAHGIVIINGKKVVR